MFNDQEELTILSDRQEINSLLNKLIGMFASPVLLGQTTATFGHNQEKNLGISFSEVELLEIGEDGSFVTNNQAIWFLNVAGEWTLKVNDFQIYSLDDDFDELDEALDYFYGKKLISVELINDRAAFHFEGHVVLEISLYGNDEQPLPPLVVTTPNNKVVSIDPYY